MAGNDTRQSNAIQSIDLDMRSKSPVERAQELRAFYDGLPEPVGGKRGKLDIGAAATPQLVAQASVPGNAPYLVFRVTDFITKQGNTVNPLGDFGQALEARAPLTDGAAVEQLADGTAMVYIPNNAVGGALVGSAAFQAKLQLGTPEGASPAFLKAMGDAERGEQLVAGAQLIQGFLDVADIGNGLRAARDIGRQMASSGKGAVTDSIGGAAVDPGGNTVRSAASNGRVSPELARQYVDKPVPGVRDAKFVYDKEQGRLGIELESGAKYWFQQMGERTIVASRLTAVQRRELDFVMRAKPGDANAPVPLRSQGETEIRRREAANAKLEQQRQGVLGVFDPKKTGPLTPGDVALMKPNPKPQPSLHTPTETAPSAASRISKTAVVPAANAPSSDQIQAHNRTAVGRSDDSFVLRIPNGSSAVIDTNNGKGLTPAQIAERLNNARGAGIIDKAPQAMQRVVEQNRLGPVIGVDGEGRAFSKPKPIAAAPVSSRTAVKVSNGVANLPTAAQVSENNRNSLNQGANTVSLRIPTREGVIFDSGNGKGITVTDAARGIEEAFDKKIVAPGQTRQSVIAGNGLDAVLTVEKGTVRQRHLNEVVAAPSDIGRRAYDQSLSQLAAPGIVLAPTSGKANRDRLVAESAARNAKAIDAGQLDHLTLVGIGPRDRGFLVENRTLNPQEAVMLLNKAKQMGLVPDAQRVINDNGLARILTVDAGVVRKKTPPEVAGAAPKVQTDATTGAATTPRRASGETPPDRTNPTSRTNEPATGDTDPVPAADGGNGSGTPPRIPPSGTAAVPPPDDGKRNNDGNEPIPDRTLGRTTGGTQGGAIDRVENTATPDQSFRITFRREDRPQVDAYFRQMTGMSLDEIQAGRNRGDDERPTSPIDALLSSNPPTGIAPKVPIVIEDTFHGRKATMRVGTDGKATLNMDTGIKVASNVVGVPRIDERVLSEDIFKTPQLRDELVLLYANVPLVRGQVLGVPAPVGAVNLQFLATIPLGTGSNTDLRGLKNSIELLNDVRKSRDQLQSDGNYLQDIKPLRLALSEASKMTDARIAADGFMPLNLADAILPRFKNEQRIYIPNTVKAIDVERGLNITKAGVISVNADLQPDGTYRMKEGTQLTINLRDANDSQLPYVSQWLLGGIGAASGDPGGILTTTAAQVSLSLLKGTDGLAAVNSTGYMITLTPKDIIPAPVIQALNDGFNKPNVFRPLEKPGLGTVMQKYAQDRPILFVRLDPNQGQPLAGYPIPRLNPDGTVASQGGTNSLRQFWQADQQKPTDLQNADLQARLNANIGNTATPELGKRDPDNLAKIYRLFPVTALKLDIKGGGVAKLNDEQRMALLNIPLSANSAKLERPEFAGNGQIRQQPWFRDNSRQLDSNLKNGTIATTPPRLTLMGADLPMAQKMQQLLADLPADSALYAINHIDTVASEPPVDARTRNPVGARLDSVNAAMFSGGVVTADARSNVRGYLDQVIVALPIDRRKAFVPVVGEIMNGLQVGRAAAQGTIEKLDTVRLALEVTNPNSADRLDAARSLTERVAVAQLNQQRRQEWGNLLSPSYQARVPNWEQAITSVTGGVLPPLNGDYGHEIKALLQRQGAGNLNGIYVRVPADALVPRNPIDKPDRPYYDFTLNQDEFIHLLDLRVKGSRREQVLAESGLSEQVYVGAKTEDYKFNFSAPRVDQRFGPTPEMLNPFALAPTPGVNDVRSPEPLVVGGRRLEIADVDPISRELVVVPEGSADRFVSQYDLLEHRTKGNFLTGERAQDVPGQLVSYAGQNYRLSKIETQSDANGFTLKPVDVSGTVIPDGKAVFVPQFKLPGITTQIDGKTYRPVGTSWTQVQFQPDITPERVNLEPGTQFETFIDDPASGSKASGGAVGVEVTQRGTLLVRNSANPTITVGQEFDLSKIVPTITTKRSQHTTGEHLADQRGVVPIGSPVKVRTADVLTSNNRASPPAGTLGLNNDTELTYVRGQKAFSSVANFIDSYQNKTPPKALILQNVVYELVSKPDSSSNFKSARPILDALVRFRERYPDTPITVYSSNERIALKLPAKLNTLPEMQQLFDNFGIEFRSRTPSGIPQTTHAKSVSIVAGIGGKDAALVTTSGFEPRPRGKSDFNIKLAEPDAKLFNLYTRLATIPNFVTDIEGRQRLVDELADRGLKVPLLKLGDEAQFREVRDQVAKELANRGVLVQDPAVGQSYIQAGYRDLITSADPKDRVIIAQLREMRMPNLTEMLIAEARKGKQVLIQTSVFDAESYRLLQEAMSELPNLKVEKIGGSLEPPDYAHYNAIITGKGMVIASAYPWSSMMDAKSEQPSSELGVMLNGGSSAYNDALSSINTYQEAVKSDAFMQAYRQLMQKGMP